MAKMVFSALIKRRGEGVAAKAAEFPDIKVRSWSVDGALARLRQAIRQRMRWTRIDLSCTGEPIGPVPEPPSPNGLSTAIELEIPADGVSQLR